MHGPLCTDTHTHSYYIHTHISDTHLDGSIFINFISLEIQLLTVWIGAYYSFMGKHC